MSDEERLDNDEELLERRLRRFRALEPPSSIWDLAARRMQKQPRGAWRYLAAATAVLLIALVGAWVIVTHEADVKKQAPRAVAASGAVEAGAAAHAAPHLRAPIGDLLTGRDPVLDKAVGVLRQRK